jgi:predicted nuclease of restriction endonuclease-like (RecB) superfamily
MSNLTTDKHYRQWLINIKQRIRQSQLKAATAVNAALLEFYWNLGADIVEKQKHTAWGSGFLKQLSRDLMAEFPAMKGFSLNNLQYIKRWYSFYCGSLPNCGTTCSTIAKQPVSFLVQIPWGHNLTIISKCDTPQQALFYVQKTIENNWSRSVLTHQIESDLYSRQAKAITNFENTLPAPQSDLAREIIKDPYNFDFLTLRESHTEKELENNLTGHISAFLIELGAGFAYLGKQVPLQVGERDFFLDLLFYHTKLHCYVVIELKVIEFEPEHAGKLNFYIKAVDEQLRTHGDNPTIGILLCKSKDKIVAEYALSDILKPMGVTEYQLTQVLPEELKSSLPTIEQIEAELANEGKK